MLIFYSFTIVYPCTRFEYSINTKPNGESERKKLSQIDANDSWHSTHSNKQPTLIKATKVETKCGAHEESNSKTTMHDAIGECWYWRPTIWWNQNKYWCYCWWPLLSLSFYPSLFLFLSSICYSNVPRAVKRRLQFHPSREMKPKNTLGGIQIARMKVRKLYVAIHRRNVIYFHPKKVIFDTHTNTSTTW